MKRLLGIVRAYSLLSIALLSVVLGLVLELLKYHAAAHWLLSLVSIGLLLPLLWEMWQDLRSGRYGVDILAATAVIAAIVLGQYWAGIIIVLILTGRGVLADFAKRRAEREQADLKSYNPKRARVIRKGKTLEVRAAELHRGDKIIVEPGQLVPADCLIIEGASSFDEAWLTGESQPQSWAEGDLLLGGTLNLDNTVTAKVVAASDDSQYKQITKLVRGADAGQAPLVRLYDLYSLPFIFLAYAAGLAVWGVSGQAIRFLEVLVVATPYPLLLAPPVALIGGMSHASRHGIVVKTGRSMERLSTARAIAFGKSGILTRGEPAVDSIKTFGGFSESEVLKLAASLEQTSGHPVGEAIVESAKAQGIKLVKAKHAHEVAGRGISASLQGQAVLVGRLSFINDEGIVLPPRFKPDTVKQTVVYVAVSGQLAGLMTFKDDPRAEAEATLSSLRQLGVQDIIMLTGDSQSAAAATAKQLKISSVYAEMLPADKIHRIEKTKQRPLIFVGVNHDTPALTAADVGLVLGARGKTSAGEVADVLVMSDDLSWVAVARHIARQTTRIARQSALLGLALSLLLIAVFATGKFSPLTGAPLLAVIDVIVVISALRASQIKINS